MSIEARNRTVSDWFARIRTRQTVLPRFQRYEAWSHSNIAQLFNTILQGLPVGSLLILEIGDKSPFICRSIVGAPETGERITENLLDGQQRITALWRGLHNNYSDRTYFVYFQQNEENGKPYFVDSIARWKQENDKDSRPFWANNPTEQWNRRAIPLDFFAPTDDSYERYKQWSKDAIADSVEREKITEDVWRIRQKFVTFNLPYLSLPVQTPPGTALDVFIKMNTSAAPLSTFDIIVAQVEATMSKSLRDLVSETKSICSTISSYYDIELLTLAASALLQGRAPTNTNYLSKEFGANLIANWDKYNRGVVRTVAFLEDERIFDAARLPTDVIVPMLVALWAEAPEGLDAEGRARMILRRYIWRAFFTKRYEASTATRSVADYHELKALIADSASAQPAIFDDSLYPLPLANELITASWPKNKDRLARAVLALSLRNGGIDLADGSTVSRANLARREYHHLFPVAYLRRKEVPDQNAFCALNCALVTWRTNRTISDKEPERYLAERKTTEDPEETEIRARLESHLIPYDAMVTGNYQSFLTMRAEIVEAAMKKLCLNGNAPK